MRESDEKCFAFEYEFSLTGLFHKINLRSKTPTIHNFVHMDDYNNMSAPCSSRLVCVGCILSP